MAVMVTTIKITCDGVFIQSNSYLAAANRSQRSSAASSPASTTASSSLPGVGPGSDQGSSSGGEADQEDQMSGFNGSGVPTKGDQRDGNNNRDFGDPRSTHNSFQKIARRRYQSEEVLSRYQKISEGSDGSSSSDMVDTVGRPIYYNSGAESDDQFTISFLNTPRGQSGKSLLNQKFIVYNSKKPKPSIVLQQSGYHPSQYRQFLNGRLKPAFSTSVLTSPSLINAAASGSRPATATPPPGSVSSLSPSSGFASASPTPTPAPSSNLGQ